MAEKYANDFSTTLVGAIDAATTSITVAAAAPAALQGGEFRAKLHDPADSTQDELVLVTSGQNGTGWTITRGVEGSTAHSHANGVQVIHVLTAASLAASSQEPLDAHLSDTTAAHPASAIGFTPGALLSDNVQGAVEEVLLSAGGSPGPAGAGAYAAYLVSGGGAAAGAQTLTLERALDVAFDVRVGRFAINVGTIFCEIAEVTAVAGAVLTLDHKLYNAHGANAKVVFFGESRVPFSWWGCRRGDSTFDNRLRIQAMGRACAKSGSAPPVGATGGDGEYYVSGSICWRGDCPIDDYRFVCMSEDLYTGPRDGPDLAAQYTNSVLQFSNLVHKWSYDSASNTFTVLKADGTAETSNSIAVNTKLMFDAPDAAQGLTNPTNLVPGRHYRCVTKMTTSTFRIQDRSGATLSFGSNGTGYVHIGLQDNNKVYMRRGRIDANFVGRYSCKGTTADNGFTTYTTTSYTTARTNNFQDGDPVRLYQPATGSGPGGVPDRAVYYARDIGWNGTGTFRLALTAGGAAIAVTADGGCRVKNEQRAVNGVILATQQPAFTEHMRVDACPGFGGRYHTQQAVHTNVETIDCGVGIELGGEDTTHLGEFHWFLGANPETCKDAAVRIRRAKVCAFWGFHAEQSSSRECAAVVFDIVGPVEGLTADNVYIGGNGLDYLIRNSDPSGYLGTSYTIRDLHGAFPSTSGDVIAIEDLSNGVQLDMYDQFGADGIMHLEVSAPNSITNHKIRQLLIGPRGQRWIRGGGDLNATGDEYWHSARGTTGDVRRVQTWEKLATNPTLDPATDIFTLAGHGLTDGQFIHVYNATNTTGTNWLNDTIYRVAFIDVNTFQIRQVPGRPVTTWVTGAPTTGWQIRVLKLRFRRNLDGRLVEGAQTSDILTGDISAGELSTRYDATTGAPEYRVSMKDLGGNLVAVPLSTLRGSITNNWASIADNAQASVTVPVVGAVVGDFAQAAQDLAPPAGVILHAQVTAADTVTVTCLNRSGSAYDPASTTLRVAVLGKA